MNAVLNEDFEKKMAVVGLLKQYAQQRDVETFARGLCVVLATQTHQSLLHYIRYATLLSYTLQPSRPSSIADMTA